jgi:hypothetical protein
MNTVAFFSLGFWAAAEDEFLPAVTYNHEFLIYVLLKMKYTRGLWAQALLAAV